MLTEWTTTTKMSSASPSSIKSTATAYVKFDNDEKKIKTATKLLFGFCCKLFVIRNTRSGVTEKGRWKKAWCPISEIGRYFLSFCLFLVLVLTLSVYTVYLDYGNLLLLHLTISCTAHISTEKSCFLRRSLTIYNIRSLLFL